MNIKRQILSLLMVLAFCAVTQAQPSAQATMEVSVRIVSGLSTTANTTQVHYADGQFNGTFGSLSVIGRDGSDVLVTSESKLKLFNQDGDQITVSVKRDEAKKRLERQYNFAIAEDGEKSGAVPNNGIYRGSLQTTIEYM